MLFEEILTMDFLASIDPTRRQRHFGHIPVFWTWIAQILEGNDSCQKAVAMIQSWSQANGLPVPASSTSSYCQARQRLSEEFLEAIDSRLRTALDARTRDEDLWHGLRLKAVDGSSVQLMDTPANQATFPQPSSQKPGCGFPVMGFVGLLDLSHGGWQAVATGNWKAHDAPLGSKLTKHLSEGDLLLGDRAFCTYELIALARAQGAHILMRLHQARHRKLDWRKGKKINPNERIVIWEKPLQQPRSSTMSRNEWDGLPQSLTLRYIQMSFEDRYGRKQQMVVVTTLIDPARHDGSELFTLYARRWEIELRFRDVKTTLGMERFEVRSPEMAAKTLSMMIIAYNLLRLLMQRAATQAGKPVRQISFKATLDLITSSHESFRPHAHKPRKRLRHREEIYEILATKILPVRPFRNEPRATKRRPKPLPYLTAPRHTYVPIPHKEGGRKQA